MNIKNIVLAISAAFIAAGCAVRPVAISDHDHLKRAAEDQRRLFDDQDPVSEPLTLHAAIARALKYNMDYRTRLMEEAAALGQAELANYDMLPKLTAAAGYSTRTNDAFGYGFTPTGSISTLPSAASERTHSYNSLSFSWNVLDFGLSYLRAKQLADQSLISEERRRKAAENLIQDVRSAWWRVEAAQRLLPESDVLLAEVDQTAARARLIEARKLLPPLQIVAYKRSLLDLEQQISLRRQELVQAKAELAQLLNLRPGLEYTVAAPTILDPTPPDLTANIAVLEQIAVSNRPELREEGYRERINSLEGDKALLSLLPSLSVDTGTNYDSNKYLVNNRWSSSGINLSWNLMRLVSLPSQLRSIDATAQVDQTRRLATTVAVLGQTRLAAIRYRLLTQELAIWDDAVNDDIRIIGYLNASKTVGLETELELIRAKARGMISRINRDLVYASVQSAVGRIYNSIGIDTLTLDGEARDSMRLAQALEQTIENWEQRSFSPKAAIRHLPVAVARVEGLTKPEDANEVMMSAVRILRLAKIAVVGPDQTAPYRIESSVSLKAPGVSGQPSVVRVRLIDGASGKLLFESEQNSTLVTPVGPDQWRALGESVGYRAIDPVRKHLTKKGESDASALTAPDLPEVDTNTVPDAQTLASRADRRKVETANAIAEAKRHGEGK